MGFGHSMDGLNFCVTTHNQEVFGLLWIVALTQYSQNLWNLASRLFQLTLDGGTNTVQSESVELGIRAVLAHCGWRLLWNLAFGLFRLIVDRSTNTVQSESVELGIRAVLAHCGWRH